MYTLCILHVVHANGSPGNASFHDEMVPFKLRVAAVPGRHTVPVLSSVMESVVAVNTEDGDGGGGLGGTGEDRTTPSTLPACALVAFMRARVQQFGPDGLTGPSVAKMKAVHVRSATHAAQHWSSVALYMLPAAAVAIVVSKFGRSTANRAGTVPVQAWCCRCASGSGVTLTPSHSTVPTSMKRRQQSRAYCMCMIG